MNSAAVEIAQFLPSSHGIRKPNGTFHTFSLKPLSKPFVKFDINLVSLANQEVIYH